MSISFIVTLYITFDNVQNIGTGNFSVELCGAIATSILLNGSLYKAGS
jgi:hypothetical protein